MHNKIFLNLKGSFLILLLLLLLFLGGLDLYYDYLEHTRLLHILVESLFLVFVILFLGHTIQEYHRQWQESQQMKHENKNLKKELTEWRQETQALRKQMQGSIHKKFIEWGLSPAEQRVGFLILRGFSFQQIANLLQKSERTVRKQAIEIYRKTGFYGRSDFTGFFLEDLFQLPEDESESSTPYTG